VVGFGTALCEKTFSLVVRLKVYLGGGINLF